MAYACHRPIGVMSFTCRGQLHLGFLTAAIYESLVEVEASRVLRQLYDAKRPGHPFGP